MKIQGIFNNKAIFFLLYKIMVTKLSFKIYKIQIHIKYINSLNVYTHI